MKKIIFFLAIFISTASFAATNFEDIITQKFKEAFPNAENVKWYKYDDHHLALFDNNNAVCRATYTLDGKIISLRRDYSAKDLSPYIMSKLKERYADKEIFGITEISSKDGLNYEIVLQDDTHWLTVKSDASGSLTLDKKMKKA